MKIDSKRVKRRSRVATLVVAALLLAVAPSGAVAQSGERWIGTWSASPVAPFGASSAANLRDPQFENQTVRDVVHTTIGGSRVRIRLSNLFGSQPLVVGAAHVAIRDKGPAVVAATDRALTFGGRRTVTIPAGAIALSDAAPLDVPAGGDLAVSLYFPVATAMTSVHRSAFQTSYVANGNATGAASLESPKTIATWPFLTGVDVASRTSPGAIVALGDSITDGSNSTPDTNRRWPDVLAARLRVAKRDVAVLNQGIGGNRLLHDGAGEYGAAFGPNALARFDRDVLSQAGARWVIVLLGINDIGHPGANAPLSEEVSADDLIAGLRQLVERAHEKGLRIYGATITPFEGITWDGWFTPEKEAKRQAVNRWIRTGGAFDGVIDFEKAVRDPSHPTRMLAAFDSGDHLHPNDAGLEAMGRAVDIGPFR
jgi:lysophospholipase L1-like esterase